MLKTFKSYTIEEFNTEFGTNINDAMSSANVEQTIIAAKMRVAYASRNSNDVIMDCEQLEARTGQECDWVEVAGLYVALIKASSIDETIQETIEELDGMYQECMPDNETIEDDEELSDEIDTINALLADDSADKKEKLTALISFNTTWFPDGLDASEQKPYKELLHAATALVNTL